MSLSLRLCIRVIFIATTYGVRTSTQVLPPPPDLLLYLNLTNRKQPQAHLTIASIITTTTAVAIDMYTQYIDSVLSI